MLMFIKKRPLAFSWRERCVVSHKKHISLSAMKYVYNLLPPRGANQDISGTLVKYKVHFCAMLPIWGLKSYCGEACGWH